jgi:hypothetical protein
LKLQYGPAFTYPFKRKEKVKYLLIGSLCSLVLPLIFGYFIRTYRKIIHGEDKEPPPWDDMMEIFSQGMIGLFIVLIYIFFPLLLILIGYLLIGGGDYLISSEGAISFTGMLCSILIIIGILLLLVAIFLLPMALAFYADTLDIMEALYLHQVVAKIFAIIEDYCMAIFIFSIVSLAILGIFIFIFPLAIFYLYLFFAWVFGQVYSIE